MPLGATSSPAPAPPCDARPTALVAALLAICAAAVVAIAIFQAVTPITYVTAWDVDPRSESGKAPVTELTPEGYAVLCAVSVGVAAVSLLIHHYAGGRVHRTSFVFVALGSIAAMWHMFGHIADLSRCGGWIAAMSLGLAAFHLGSHLVSRRIIIAATLALIVPFFLQAVWYVAVTHPQTVRDYMKKREVNLRERGWAPDSAMAQLFERRMRDNQVTGAYAMSNVHGSIAAAMTAAAFGVAAGTWRRQRKVAIGSALLCIGGATVVLLTKSKGAAAACALACAWVIFVGWWTSRRETSRWWMFAAPLLVSVAIAAVPLRMLAPPPTAERGERSLYVRWQYWTAATRMSGAIMPLSPTAALVGVGPERFHEDYTLYKDPRNPEEVTSAHAAFVDWPVMLGLGGVAWCAVTMLWLAGAMRVPRDEALSANALPSPPSIESSEPYTRRGVILAHLLALVIFVPQQIIQLPMMLPETALLWLVGVEIFAVIVYLLLSADLRSPRVLAIAAGAAGIVVLVHSQIEMTLFNTASAAFALVLLGVAGGTPAPAIARQMPPSRAAGVWNLSAVFAVAGLFVVIAIGYAGRMLLHESHTRRAAEALRDKYTTVSPSDELDAALSIIPNDPSLVRSRAERDFEAGNLALYARDRDGARRAFANAEIVLERSRARGVWDHRLRRAAAQLNELLATTFGETERFETAIAFRRELAQLNPASLNDHLSLADVLWSTNRRDEAKAVYRKCLELSDLASMDRAKQLSDNDRVRVEQRLGE